MKAGALRVKWPVDEEREDIVALPAARNMQRRFTLIRRDVRGRTPVQQHVDDVGVAAERGMMQRRPSARAA